MSAQKAMSGAAATNGVPTQGAKKAAARRKLAAFEYTNEAIEKISVAPPAPAVLANTSIESIISRVEERKAQNVQRSKKRATTLALNELQSKRGAVVALPSVSTSRLESASHASVDANDKCEALNSYFAEYLSVKPHLLAEEELLFPLHAYDDLCLGESMMKPTGFPFNAIVLMQGASPDGSPRDRGLGQWVSCEVLKSERGGTQYMIAAAGGDVFSSRRFHICLLEESLVKHAARVEQALLRRAAAVNLMRYQFIVDNIPYDSRIVTTLEAEQCARIAKKATNMTRLLGNNLVPTLEENIEQYKAAYEGIMKKIIYDMNILHRSNIDMFIKLHIPLSLIYERPSPMPLNRSCANPQFKQATVLRAYNVDGYFSSVEAIRAMQQVVLESQKIEKFSILNLTYTKSMHLDKVDRYFAEMISLGARAIKQDWLVRSAHCIRDCFAPTTDGKYDITQRNGFEYEKGKSNIKCLLDRVSYLMSTVLVRLLEESLDGYTSFISELCRYTVDMDSIQEVKVHLPFDSIYKAKVLPPLAIIFLRVTEDKHVLNQEDVDANRAQIAEWKKTPEALEGGNCPIKLLPENWGNTLEYNYSMDQFKQSILAVFDNLLAEFAEVSHIEKFVMEKIFFPRPKTIRTVLAEWDHIKELREQISRNVDSVTAPLVKYLLLFKQYEGFINVNIADHVQQKIQVNHRDPESSEIELPVTVTIAQIISVLEVHFAEIEKVERALPLAPLECGIFIIQLSSVRKILVDKHRDIIQLILSNHSNYCRDNIAYLDSEFKKILKALSKKPENIEELTELQDYMSSLTNTMMPLTSGTQDTMAYYDLLDKYVHKVDFEDGLAKWTVFGYPGKIAAKCDDVVKALEQLKIKYNNEMKTEQTSFTQTLVELEKSVVGLEVFRDLKEVQEAAVKVREVEESLISAQEKIKLFNSRETLFEQDLTDYEDIGRVVKLFEPYAALWTTASEWVNLFDVWMKGRFVDLDAEDVEKKVDKYFNAITKASKYFVKMELHEQVTITNTIKNQVNDFRPEVPLLVALRNPGMRERHWEMIQTQLKIELMPIEEFSLERVLAFNLKNSQDLIFKIGESAAKEYQIEQALDKMEREWHGMDLQISNYKDTGTGVLKGIDDLNVVLDEQITMTQTIMFSAFKGPFEARIDEWNRKLCCISDLLEVWVAVQRSWLYLQPIFESADINRQLPVEGKKFAMVDKSWRSAIAAARANSKAIEFCDNEKLLEKFRESNILLEQVQKGLSDYLETKRSVFARFYFLSNDELLSILSESKDVKLVQPHLKKCFEAIDKVKFLPDLKIDRFISPEGEEVMVKEILDPVDKSVEVWMLELEGMMRISVREVMKMAIEDYLVTPRPKWMQKWPSMCVINGSQAHWTSEMETLFAKEGEKGPKIMLSNQIAQLADMTILVRGELSKAARNVVGALTVIDVHARDVIKKLADENVDSPHNFGWTSQLRYYWDNDLMASMVAAKRSYGYEYLGNTFRLVITPLTDKCYLTLMGALQMIFGGAPAGPAGTGKTETTKDLAKALAMQCVVFNCSDGLDYLAMGKFFKGLASCGAWACFDEFNRINIEVLSVIGQQVMSIQQVLRSREPRMQFEGSDIAVSANFAVFITMNPGYAGRSALPDSLSALFRPVAMMVPDYALIGEIMFFAYGFEYARECGAKMVTTFKLCSEQLSSQPHYDYGMRAVTTVIRAGGNLKRAEPQADEMVLLLRALQDVNIPKFLEMDLPLFEGIISDLFPGKKRPELNYGALMATMKNEIQRNGLQPVSFFKTKVIQLYEMIVVRHGLMLVGPTGGGKSSNLHVLEQTLGSLKDQKVEGFAYEKVQILQLNPKSITMGQMYGEFDPNTLEWRDGIMSTMYRNATVDTPDRKWIYFDGPVDAIWIESMNTVLDDNKKLCLLSGEIIKMSNEMTMMFEVEDLTVASPATVSRVGIIYMEPKGLGLDVLVQSWIYRLPECIPKLMRSKLTLLFDSYMYSSIFFLRTYLKELVPSVDNNLAESLMRILDCYFEPFYPQEGRSLPSDLMIADMLTCIEPLFLFALTWSVGATTNEDGRAMFSSYLRTETTSLKVGFPYPKQGQVYDFMFNVETKKWTPWMELIEKFDVDTKLSFSEIVVPTMDSVRNTYLLDLLLPNDKHIIMVGATGTGKTVNINQYLQGFAKVQGRTVRQNVIPMTMTFSANTGANMTQDLLDSKMDKRRKGVYGPPAGKKFYIYVDDLNMPKREEYGAQPPIEILRQWFDQGGWYDRKELVFRKLIDLTFVCSMGPPGGGRQEITPRFLRHFNLIGYVEMSDSSKFMIFGSILRSYLTPFEGGLVQLTDTVVKCSVDLFSTIVTELLPTPSKSHYTFNLRDLAKIFQGMLMMDAKKMNNRDQLARLWVHECQRVFSDRLTCDEDRNWLKSFLKAKIEREFNMVWETVVPRPRLIYGDFINAGSEVKYYEEMEDMDKVKLVVEEYLTDHNSESKQPMPLVMFADALEHVARIARILRQPQGNALLLGVGGSGRQSMTKLATFITGYQLANVEIVKGYSMNDWREDLKRILMQAGVKDKQTTFLFSDVQIINERMVEDINNILNAGDVPNLYANEDLEAISTVCRIECQKKKIPPTKLNIFAQYIIRVRRNIHLCVCMSPIGEAFRNRLRNYPSLVNCCTIDWFSNWPAEALQSVGLSILRKTDLGLGEFEGNSVEMFKNVHLSVEKSSVVYYDMLRRRNYVTPTSYLELLSSFAKLIGINRTAIATKRDRLQIGLDKLTETKSLIGGMQEELKVLQPQIVQTQQEVAVMMVDITRDKAAAAVTKEKVEVEEQKANGKAAEAKAIADDAQRDLAEAIPALEEAVKCLNDLKKSDIDEVKSLKTPPSGVVLTLKVCCFMFDVKPIKKNDPNNPGKKIEDYWEAGKTELLKDAKAFLNSLFEFDKDHIPDRIIQAITPFMEDPEFTPAAVKKASVACTAICMWARAMFKYHFVALGVAPKRAKLKEAEDELAIVMAQLKIAKDTLAEVNNRLATLEKQFNEAVAKKEELENKEATCKTQLSNADKLIGGLGGEEKRWRETVAHLSDAYINILGDIIVSAGAISYLGPFTAEFRTNLVQSWQKQLKQYGIPHSSGCSVETTLADPVKLRAWQLCQLPTDLLSTQNAIMMDNGRRWPLLIDPQGQANRYIRAMSKDKNFAVNGMDVVKLTDKNFLRTLENGVQFGRWVLLENILEVLDAALEPILLQQKFKQGGQEMMKLGDNVVPYNDSFRFFMTTKLSNPHYVPEVQVKVSLLNFTITLGGLEEQLLNVVVAEELPELYKQKQNLVVQNAEMNKQLFDIESEILYLLSHSTGNILDDTVLIETLAKSKVTSGEIKVKLEEASAIEKECILQSELYRPVAKRASLLYFVIADLGNVDPMYQYSLQWFTQLFVRGIGNAAGANNLDQRVINLNDYFTYSVYQNICRSLFESHKLLFSFILCVKILQGENKIDATEYRYLLCGISTESVSAPLPESNWLEPNVWEDLLACSGLPAFRSLPETFPEHLNEWQDVFDSSDPHKRVFPAPFENLSSLERLCILRCLRRDKIELAMQDFICEFLDQRFIQPPPFDLRACYNDSTVVTPLIFVLSSGSDPNKDLDILAEELSMTDRLKRIALGQGQGKKASTMVEKGMQNGDWVMLQNCHLSISWMPILEQTCEAMEADKIHPDFRLWLTSKPSESFPTSVLQNGVKITKEPPAGLRANLKNTYLKLDNEKLKRTNKVKEFQQLLFGLSFFHALVIERRKFGPLGWNIPYEFNDTDRDISAAQLELYVSSYDDIPFKVLQQLTSVVNYGGRITDDKDMRTSDIIIADFFNPKVFDSSYKFSQSGLYYSMIPDKDAPHTSYMEYIDSLPLNPEPEVFGMHDNANITCAITTADTTFEIILSLQPRLTGGTGISREDQIIEMAKNMATVLPQLYDIEAVGMLYPTDYHESMNTVLVQECQRYNRLLAVMHVSLRELQRALKGLVVLSAELEAMGNAVFDQRVPNGFTAVAYPSLKPLTPWFKDLMQRLEFLTTWVEKGIPPVYWISGFFFPQGFTTATLQNYARKYRYPIDTVSFSFVMRDELPEELGKPDDGVFIYGLFLEGARWDKSQCSLVDPKPKELFSPMPTIHLLPVQYRETPQSGIYRCPVYKVLTRTGTLSTTGHSTNFVTWIEIPSNQETIYRSSLVSETNAQVKFCDQSYWIKAGVACFCALRY